MLPNYPHKHQKQALFTPQKALDYRICKKNKPDFKVPKGVVFCINRDLLDYILKNYEYREVEGFFANCYLVQDVLVVSKFGIGAPSAVVLFEEFIAYGVKNFLLAGNAGGLSPGLDTGDFVVCEKAIRDEGLSYHYIPPAKYIEAPEMKETLKGVLEKHNIKYHAGVSWTTDAFFRETKEEVKHYQEEGVLTVEMEASALFAIAGYRSVNLAALFTISDSLASLEWEPKWHELENFYEDLFKVSVETINN